jgi:hypothetical protein
MNIPANGITAEIIREVMPPNRLSPDPLSAMFAAVPAPPPNATMAWRQTRAARLVQEVAGLMPADAPQAQIAAEIVIVREATDDTFARADAPGLTVEPVCRPRRTAVGLTTSGVALERCVVWRQRRPAPFFGTVLAKGIDVAALAAGWVAWVHNQMARRRQCVRRFGASLAPNPPPSLGPLRGPNPQEVGEVLPRMTPGPRPRRTKSRRVLGKTPS